MRVNVYDDPSSILLHTRLTIFKGSNGIKMPEARGRDDSCEKKKKKKKPKC